jgi:hypothetical protein
LTYTTLTFSNETNSSLKFLSYRNKICVLAHICIYSINQQCIDKDLPLVCIMPVYQYHGVDSTGGVLAHVVHRLLGVWLVVL